MRLASVQLVLHRDAPKLSRNQFYTYKTHLSKVIFSEYNSNTDSAFQPSDESAIRFIPPIIWPTKCISGIINAA